MSNLSFLHLNPDWNADPNGPSLDLTFSGTVAKLSFLLNYHAYKAVKGETATIRFIDCSRWRWDATNDHAWFEGSGRFSGEAPKWGEFYEVVGEDKLGKDLDWEIISPDVPAARHFLFYFRDETIECIAADWSIEREPPV